MARLEKAHFALVGTTSDIRREMDLLVETANPEWFIWQSDQGYLPLEQVNAYAATLRQRNPAALCVDNGSPTNRHRLGWV
jgi:UDP-N-acetyl-D-mannosaminuronic acid transferase (WecB/TagA/CpsF family)